MRSRNLRLALFWVVAWYVAAAPAAECPGIAPNNQPRLLIPLFQYKGAEHGEARNQFSRYRGVIGVKFQALVDETQSPAKQRDGTQRGTMAQAPAYLRKLRVHVPDGTPIIDNLATEGDRQSYWEATHSLELLRGTLWSGEPYFVDSEIYIGELRGHFPRRDVRVRLLLEPEEVPKANDTHSVVTYYALAMDARELECDPAIVRHFLSGALSILKDLKGRQGGKLAGDLADLETVIVAELEGTTATGANR